MATPYLELLLARIRFRIRMLRFALTVQSVAGGEDPPDDEPADKDKDDPDDKDEPADKDKDDPDDKVKPDDDWKAKSRKNENRAKKAEKELADLRKRLETVESEGKTEHEKAVEQARKEAADEARSEADKERRKDRLEVAVTRAAARGIKIGEGDDAKTVKFADPEDALLNIQSAIDRGDVDADDIYDSEGKVDSTALETALAEIAGAKPHLLAGADRRKAGDPDTRKGEPVDKDLERLTPEEHAQRKYGKK